MRTAGGVLGGGGRLINVLRVTARAVFIREVTKIGAGSV